MLHACSSPVAVVHRAAAGLLRRGPATRRAATSSASRRPPSPPSSSRPAFALKQLSARSQLETAAGCAATAVLASLIVADFARTAVLSETPIGAIRAAEALSASSLLGVGPVVLLTSPFLHTDLVHVLVGLLSTTVAGVAAAVAPTYAMRGAAIPAVFLAASSVAGLARVWPDLAEAARSADAESARRSGSLTPLPSVEAAARTQLAADYNVAAYLRALSSAATHTLGAMRERHWAANDRAQSWGALDGATGLLIFACCEWGLGARVRSALIIPAAIVARAGAAWWVLPPGVGEPPRSSRGSGSGSSGDSARRGKGATTGRSSRFSGGPGQWPVDVDARTAALGTLVAAGTGAACWGAGRATRFALHVGRLALGRRGR